MYEVFFYSGETCPPAYYLIDGIEGSTAEEALMNNMEQILEKARDLFGFDNDLISNRQIQSVLYVVRRNGLLPAHSILTEFSI